MPERLTIQTFVDGEWCDVLLLSVDSIGRVAESTCTVHYDHPYLINHLDEMGSVFAPAVSINLPLDWNLSTTRGYPAFIYDIVPAGAARRSLEQRFGQDGPAGMDMELFLLSRCTPAPVGHLRIKESLEQLDLGRTQAFPRQEVVERTNDFLEYAYEQGAAIGGATGAQGEAPKLLMTEDRHGELHADAVLSDAESARHWLIKFARNRVSERDKNILRAEYHYYRAVAEPAALWAQLLETAEMFRALPELLQDLPEEIRAAQSIPLNNLDERLAQWRLR